MIYMATFCSKRESREKNNCRLSEEFQETRAMKMPGNFGLITGGAGFIGSHIADALVSEGHEVLVLDDLSSGKSENVPPEARVVLCDISSDLAEETIRKFQPEIVSHHAAG